MKLEGCQENFKVTLLERPPKKSCSTSTFSREISLQIFSPTFLKRFPCKLSKPSKSSKLSKISRQQASQATQACQAHQASQAKQASLQARQANRIQTASQQVNWAKRIKPKSGKHACTAREPSKSSYISKVELAHEQRKQIKAKQVGK